MHNQDWNLRDIPGASNAPADLTPIIAESLAHNRGPDPDNLDHRQSPDYGVVATLEGAILEIFLTFRRGSAYCCPEWECHVGLRPGKRWGNLRRKMNDAGIAVKPRLELRGTCMIEEGTNFFDFSKPHPDRSGWYGFAPTEKAWSYKINYSEGVD